MMKPLLTAVFFAFCFSLTHAAETLAILSRGERVVADSTLREKQAFVASVATADPSLDQELAVINPPDWGKTLGRGTHGTVAFKRSFPGAFFGRIKLEGLVPEHRYLLAFNGRPDLKGNELLLSSISGNPAERYYDFLDLEADRDGRFDASVAVRLKPGAYHVRLYVKDTADWKIVLYRDYFEFTVE